jgi:hypothetical protein
VAGEVAHGEVVAAHGVERVDQFTARDRIADGAWPLAV